MNRVSTAYRGPLRATLGLAVWAVGSQLQAASARQGIECGCGNVGDYVALTNREVQWTATSSADSNALYQVEVLNGGGTTLVVRSNGQKVMQQNFSGTVFWGFSPDEHRLVVHFGGAGEQEHVRLYNLQKSGEEVWASQMMVAESRTTFSPNGKYLLYTARSGPNDVNLYLVDTVQRDTVWDTHFTYSANPAKYGLASWGFSPDTQDATFSYAWHDGDRVNWNVVNVAKRQFVVQNRMISSPAQWSFSPCGDAVALVEFPTVGAPNVTVERTLTEAHLISPTDIENFSRIYTTAEHHCVLGGGTEHHLAENTAGHSCGGSTPKGPYWLTGAVLTAGDIGLDSLVLTWPAALDEDSTVVSYEIGETSPKREVLGSVFATNDLRFPVTGLNANTEYRFRVRACDVAGVWSSSPVTGTAKTLAPNTGPTWPPGSSLEAVNIGESNVTVHWPAALDDVAVTAYRVYQGTQAVDTLSHDARTYTVTGLQAAQSYQFGVKAGDGDGNWSTIGLWLSVKTLDLTPPFWPPESRLYASEVGPTSVTLVWTQAQDNVQVTGYRLYLITPEEPVLLASAWPPWHFSCLRPGSTFRFKVEAGDEAGNWSLDGPATTVTTMPGQLDCPGLLERASVTGDGQEALGVSWKEGGVGRWYASSKNPALSGDGRYVAFASLAVNLVTNDNNSHELEVSDTEHYTVSLESWSYDVFVRDRFAGRTERVSVSSTGQEAQVGSSSAYPAISADGRYVAFTSWASNLVALDTNGKSDVFLHDRITGATTRVSVSSAGEQANDRSEGTAISADGRLIAFCSLASNLVPDDTNNVRDVFIYDQQINQTTRVNVSSTGAQANGDSWDPAISADGRYIGFFSTATNLVTNDTNGKADVFVRDRQTHETSRVSLSSAGEEGNGDSGEWQNYASDHVRLSLSSDGRFIAFDSAANNLVADDTNNQRDVFVRDRQTGQTERISVSSLGAEAGAYGSFKCTSWGAAISGDGRYVVFMSNSTNLAAGDTELDMDIFLRDRQAGTTEWLSRCGCGTNISAGNGQSSSPVTSADGRFVAFVSAASNLLPDLADLNHSPDIFVWELPQGPVDSDHDGIADAQEQGPMGADPNFDGNRDGLADAREFGVTTLAVGDGRQTLSVSSLSLAMAGRVAGPPDSWLDSLSAGGSALAELLRQAGTKMQIVSQGVPAGTNAPPGFSLPIGFYQFSVGEPIPSGGATLLVLWLPATSVINTVLNYGPTPENPAPHWYEFLYDGQTGAIFDAQGKYLAVFLVDGQRGDADLVPNGILSMGFAPAQSGLAAPPRLGLSVPAVLFGDRDTQGSLTLSNAGGSSMAWSIDTNWPAWLKVTPVGGEIHAGEQTTVKVMVDRRGLPLGDYSHRLIVLSGGGIGAVPVTLQAPLEFLDATLQQHGVCLELAWRSAPGKRYRLQRKSSLADPSWVDLGPSIVGTGPTSRWMDCQVDARNVQLYRVLQLD